jgi:hypothetical protein
MNEREINKRNNTQIKKQMQKQISSQASKWPLIKLIYKWYSNLFSDIFFFVTAVSGGTRTPSLQITESNNNIRPNTDM